MTPTIWRVRAAGIFMVWALGLAGCGALPGPYPAAAKATLASNSAEKDLALPAETVFWRRAALPGYALAQEKCQICHSAHYAEYQPTSSGRPYWEAQVKRMKNVFKAPIADDDIPPLVEYLVKTYGAEAGH